MRIQVRAILTTMLFSTLTLVQQCQGHGYLYDPPSRSTMWRHGFPVPANYDDNALRCGGSMTECGVCGDPVAGPRDNEAGGRYALGIISRTYTEGQVISVNVLITANHKGFFEFTLCPHDDPSTPVSETCLLNNVLELASGGTRYPLPAGVTGEFLIDVRLPVGITCTQCVFRWKYKAGNSWGTDPVTGQSGIGLGDQELFFGCADISITPSTGGAVTAAPATARAVTAAPTIARAVTAAPTIARAVTAAPTIARSVTAAPTQQRVVDTFSRLSCQPVNIWTSVAGMVDWCNNNCNRGFCPPDYCSCRVVQRTNGPTCHPINIWANVEGMVDFCNDNCSGNGNFCPPEYCSCA